MTARDADGALRGYLLACLTRRAAYVHIIATHPAARGQGVARAMYARLFSLATAAGCAVTEAVTTPENRASVAFHERWGFRATLVPDYAGPGQHRIHSLREGSSAVSMWTLRPGRHSPWSDPLLGCVP